MPTPNDFVTITRVSGELQRLTGHPGPGYRRLLILSADAVISPPMEQRSGRWGCLRGDIPALAAALGLTIPAAPRAARASKREATSVTA